MLTNIDSAHLHTKNKTSFLTESDIFFSQTRQVKVFDKHANCHFKKMTEYEWVSYCYAFSQRTKNASELTQNISASINYFKVLNCDTDATLHFLENYLGWLTLLYEFFSPIEAVTIFCDQFWNSEKVPF